MAEDDPFTHGRAAANGLDVHYVRQGAGPPLVLLHGWPEFWLTWRKNVGPLAAEFDVIAPDLRGFGDTRAADGSPTGGYTVDTLAEDLRALLDALGVERAGLVSHDVGAYVAQAFARRHPQRVTGLFFFNCPYPGSAAAGRKPTTCARRGTSGSTSSPGRPIWSPPAERAPSAT